MTPAMRTRTRLVASISC